MDNDNVINITPHEGQVKVLTTPKRFILALAGIQGGKTFIGCIWTQLQVQHNPKGTYLVCALSYSQLDDVVIAKFLEVFPAYKALYDAQKRMIALPTGGKIVFKSLDEPKYIEGITAHAAWIDEADLVGYRAYMIVRGRLGATGGKLLMTSSLADNSWLAEYMNHFDESEFELCNWPSRLNPSFSQSEWDSLKKEIDPTIFRRRYEAELDFASGRVYGGFNMEKHVLDEMPIEETIHRSFIGIDWGYNDPTAIVVIKLSDRGRVFVTRDFMIEGIPMDLVVKTILKFKQEENVTAIYADPHNKQFLMEVQNRIAHEISPGKVDIFYGTGIIRNLIFQNKFFVLKTCGHVLKELKQYRFKETLAGRSEEPDDKNNHAMDAIRYVLATYPLSSVRYKQRDDVDDLPDFWLRRTALYKRQKKESNDDIFTP